MTNDLYRLYLRASHHIVCRHEFAAGGDGEACAMAALLADAASDVCDSFDLWHRGHLRLGPARAASPALALPPTALPPALVAAADALLHGDWAAARSRNLRRRRDEWKALVGVPPLDRVIRDAVAATGADKGNIQLHDGAGNLRIAAQHGFASEFLNFFATVRDRDDDTTCGRALSVGERVIVHDVASNPIFRGKASAAVILRAGMRSACSTPIAAAGRVRGIISVHRAVNWQPGPDELHALDRFAAAAGAIIGA